MIARVARVCALVCALLFHADGLPSSSEMVFNADVLGGMFPEMETRQCLPANFSTPVTQQPTMLCIKKVNAGNLSSECDGTPTLAVYYGCIAHGVALLNDDDTFFNISVMEGNFLSFSNDLSWQEDIVRFVAKCKRMSSAKLMPVAEAVFGILCMHWSLFANCDRQQVENGTLDAEGALRRAKFLAGDCPLSPSSLLDAFGVVTGHTWAECSQGLYTGDNATLLYDAQISRVNCLLQDYTLTGNVDFSSLVSDIKNADEDDESTVLLLKLVENCATTKGLKKNGNTQFLDMTTEEFINCWAIEGVLGCAQQEANQVAKSFRETCIV